MVGIIWRTSLRWDEKIPDLINSDGEKSFGEKNHFFHEFQIKLIISLTRDVYTIVSYHSIYVPALTWKIFWNSCTSYQNRWSNWTFGKNVKISKNSEKMEEEDARRLRSNAFSRKSTDDENSNSNDGRHEESSVKVSMYLH